MSKQNSEAQGAVRVIVKFEDGVKLPYESGVEKYIQEQKVGPVDALVKEFKGISFSPLFQTTKPDVIRKLASQAEAADKYYTAPNFLTFFAIIVPEGIDPAAIAKQLMTWDTVDYAYVEGLPSLPIQPSIPQPIDTVLDPGMPTGSNPLLREQGYLNEAPEGIGAEHAWRVKGGKGERVRFVDVEFDWKVEGEHFASSSANGRQLPTHEDLQGQNLVVYGGTLNTNEIRHGTKTIGVIAAVDNDIGCVGIAPNVAEIGLSPLQRNVPGESPLFFSSPDAILAAIEQMDAGDILLLELQTGQQDLLFLAPIELRPAIWELIRMATALGIIVIEPAGNGGLDLDEIEVELQFIREAIKPSLLVEALDGDTQLNVTFFKGVRPLNRGNQYFRDSGAIMVGSCTKDVPHRSRSDSCFGSRVDCYAWGEGVQTLTTDALGTEDRYTGANDSPHFSGTSSAGAIVAGAAVVTQSMARYHLGRSLNPQEMRDILTRPVNPPDDPRINPTPSENPATDRIGVMPNLLAVIIHLDAIRNGWW